MKDILKKLKRRIAYFRTNPLLAAIEVSGIAFGLLGIPGLLFNSTRNTGLLLLALPCLVTAIWEIAYRQDREWFRKWKIYKSNLNVPSVTSTDQGRKFYQDDEKYYSKISKAME